MKRAVVTLLVVLFAVPLFAQDSKAQCVSLEHVRGAWRMQIKCEQGTGAILLADKDGAKSYRGEGVFANWTQEQLGSMYESLAPQATTPSLELMQLG